jgi:hypothetical protein
MADTASLLLGLTSWVVSTTFIFVLCCLLFSRLKTDRFVSNLVGFVSLLLFAATAYFLVLGLMGVLTPGRLLAIGGVGLAIIILIPASRHELHKWPDQLHELGKIGTLWWADLPRWLRWFTAFILIASAARFTFLILALPPFVWDSLTYHLTNVAEWTQRGQITLYETSVNRIFTPANYETFALWFTVFLHHDVVVEAAGLPAYLLAIVSVYAIGRMLDFSRAASWLGALAYAMTPALLLAVTGTKNDPHMAAYFLAMLAIILLLTRPVEEGSRDGNVLGQLVLLLILACLAFGTKAYLIHLMPGLALIALLGGRQWFGLRSWAARFKEAVGDWREASHHYRTMLVILILLGLFVGFYWNSRNLALTGNPFYPYGVNIEGEKVFEDAGKTAHLDFSRLTENIESLIWKFGDKQTRISPDLTDTTGWGWFVYSLGLVALIIGLVFERSIRVLFAGFILALALIFMSTRPSPWNMRYILWFPAVFGIAFAAVMNRAGGDRSLPAVAIRLLYAFTLTLNFIAVVNYGKFDPSDIENMLDIPIMERGSAKLVTGMPKEYNAIHDLVPEDAVLGYNVNSNGFIYPLYRAGLTQRLAFIPVDPTDSCDTVARAMAARNVRYLFTAYTHTDYQVINLLEACGNRDSVIQELGSRLFVSKLGNED